MDAALAFTRLMDQLFALLEAQDFEGAEALLSAALGRKNKYQAFLHFQLAVLYRQWNKLTSAVNHLHKAAELTKSEILVVQIRQELRRARTLQAEQQP